MKALLKTLLILTIVLNTMASDKVVYGEDNRFEIKDIPAKFQKWASATAAMIAKKDIKKGFFLFDILGLTKNYRLTNTETLFDFEKICLDEKYADQVTSSNCTGFLINKNTLVTAGHCMASQDDCDNNYWVFGYTQDSLERSNKLRLRKKGFYKCKKIVTQEYSWSSKLDYAVVRLNKRVKKITPLKIETDINNIKVGMPIAVIGTPTGLPLKFAAGAKIRSIEEDFFVANLDTFGGNSGSPVISMQSGKVVGILVRGETDYKHDDEAGCFRPNRCANDECRGEDATLITKVPLK